jgi:lipid A disaccharide synthetase
MLAEIVEGCIPPKSLKRAGFVEIVKLICCLKARSRSWVREFVGL